MLTRTRPWQRGFTSAATDMAVKPPMELPAMKKGDRTTSSAKSRTWFLFLFFGGRGGVGESWEKGGSDGWDGRGRGVGG